MEAIKQLDADVISIENSRVTMKPLKPLRVNCSGLSTPSGSWGL